MSPQPFPRGPADDDPSAGIAPDVALGLDNVPIELPVARIGSRTLALILDYLLLLILEIGWILAFVLAGAFDFGGGWAVATLFLGVFALEAGYFALLETVLDGRTPGKIVVGLRVVGRGGGRARTGSLVVRNLVRTIDLVAGLPLMTFDPLCRRLGDRLAGTLVVHDRRQGPERRPAILAEAPEGWSAERIALVESFLARAEELEPERRDEIGRRLLRGVAGPETTPADERDPVAALGRFVRRQGST